MKLFYDATFLVPAHQAGGLARDSQSIIYKLQKEFDLELYYPERYFLKQNDKIHSLKLMKIAQKIITATLNLLRFYPKQKSKFIFWQSQPGLYIPKKNTIWILRLHDIFPITYPNDFSFFQRKIFKRSLRAATSRAIIVANSLHTKAQLESIFGTNLRIFIIPCDKSDFQNIFCHRCQMCKKGKYLDYKYVLTVGTLFKRRNPQKIISFSTYLFHEANIKTIVVGRFTSIWQQIILKSGTSLNNIEFLGKICDGQLLQLYNSAVGYITFSKDEGFNIPLLDAISFGIPILASEIPAHQELLIDKDAFNEKSFLTKLQNTSSNSQNINIPFNSARNETLELFQLLRTYLND